MKYKNYAISLEFYEFMLARTKGELARKKYDISSTGDFWTDTVASTEQTVEQYYNESVLNKCKNYLAALVLFDKEGLKLTADELSAIEDEIAFYIDYDGNGDQKKLDAILSKYGTDVEGLREIYTVEAKYKKLMTLLYGTDGSQIADIVKRDHYTKNYHRFKQIFVSNFHYEYQTDEKGNIIYFDPETAKPVYDTENGKVIYVDGYSIKDQYDQPIYYDADGKILYDQKKGYPTPKLDENGEAIVYKYTESEMAERIECMQKLQSELAEDNFALFESHMPEWELYEGADEYYSDGYYLSRIESHGYKKYMLDILSALEQMVPGEIRTVESQYGYHVIMKYDLDEGKFNDVEYAEWYASFNESLQNKLFLLKCEQFYSDIKLVDEYLKKARSIKVLGTNYDY